MQILETEYKWQELFRDLRDEIPVFTVYCIDGEESDFDNYFNADYDDDYDEMDYFYY